VHLKTSLLSAQNKLNGCAVQGKNNADLKSIPFKPSGGGFWFWLFIRQWVAAC
jgi:hypothetical protein